MKQQATAWVVGNVGTEPELQGSGKDFRVKLRVLNNNRWFDVKQQDWVQGQANGTDIVCWGELARNVAYSVQVGDPVIVFGRLDENKWVDKEGGHRRSGQVIADVVAHDLGRGTAKFLRTPRSAEAGPDVAEGSPAGVIGDEQDPGSAEEIDVTAEVSTLVETSRERELAPF